MTATHDGFLDPNNNFMDIIKEETKYRIKDDNGGMIYVVVNEQNKRLNLFGKNGNREFIFKESDPKVVMKIALLLIEATKI